MFLWLIKQAKKGRPVSGRGQQCPEAPIVRSAGNAPLSGHFGQGPRARGRFFQHLWTLRLSRPRWRSVPRPSTMSLTILIGYLTSDEPFWFFDWLSLS